MQNFQLCLSKFKYVYLASKCDRRQIDSLTIELLGNSCNNCSDCQRASAHLICTLWRQLLQRHSEIHSATFSSWVYGDGFNCTMNSSSSQFFKNQVGRKNSCCAVTSKSSWKMELKAEFILFFKKKIRTLLFHNVRFPRTFRRAARVVLCVCFCGWNSSFSAAITLDAVGFCGCGSC